MSENKNQENPSRQIESALAEPRVEQSLREHLPAHISPDKLRRAMQLAVAIDPKLAQCTQASLLICAMRAAETGLIPGGALGHAYLVPYSSGGLLICTFLPGYRGLIDLARRSGKVASLRAVVVRVNDEFDFFEGFEARIHHRPALDDSAMRLVYSVCKFSDGTFDVELMTRAQIDAVRGRSKSGNNGPWATDYDEMSRKTVLRRHLKRLPLESERLDRAVEHDNEDFEKPAIDNTTQIRAAPSDLTDKLKQSIAALPERKRARIVDVVESEQAPLPIGKPGGEG